MATDRGTGTPPLLVLGKITKILDCFSVTEPEPTLREITQRSGLHASTCQRLVHNLVREGFLDRSGDRYRIGLSLVQWAAPGTFGLDIVQRIKPVLQRLCDGTGETACLYVRDGASRTVIAVAETRHVVMRLFKVGMVMPLHAGAPGKIFLAYDPAARADLVRDGLQRFTEQTPVDIDVLDEQAAQARTDGYAAAFDERHEGVGSISAPVFDHAGDLAAVLGIGAPTQRLTADDVDRLAPLVVTAAKDASAALGYRPSKVLGPRLAAPDLA
ncbi:IclR family transcriptional regulator [Kitasatospora sp. CM 4170]|uniref:IclR family transcriptional regulator n=1 Tax=Kitasatospora aburaviensis TaxID=67265 RepID=A0ABW1FDF0_9ACTN|nr:IclR family transcriptional regulator [Kitasatospora sp. CM 4170]WNM43468.1 IclR family transcriptional regulator [Kitasatospora sp. CM 4170]